MAQNRSLIMLEVPAPDSAYELLRASRRRRPSRAISPAETPVVALRGRETGFGFGRQATGCVLGPSREAGGQSLCIFGRRLHGVRPFQYLSRAAPASSSRRARAAKRAAGSPR